MPPSPHGPRAQEKLDIILGQVTGLRSRLNWLAAQHVIYLVFAIVVASLAIFLAGAVVLTPMQFLGVGGVTAILALYALLMTLRSGWRRRSNAARAAALADDRAGLKGRLTTIVQTVSFGRRSALWSYLVEDALSHREEFTPRQIERRRIARSWWAPIAAMALATVLIPIARAHHATKIAAAQGGDADMTVDLDDLHLRPAEPGDNTGLQVKADAATMARLREKLAREGEAAGKGDGGKFSGLLNRARNLADSMQSKLRGDSNQKQRLTLRLADNDAGLDPSNPRGPDLNRKTRRGDQAGQFKRDSPADDEASLPPIDDSLREPDAEPSAGENAEGGADSGTKGNTLNAQNDSGRNGPDDDDVARGDQSYNGGSVHGIGADPDSLFGEASKSKMGTEGFEIAIEARPIDQGTKGAGQAYLPPKVHTPLNAHQEPDEPIARAAVPPNDRTAIERVFER